MRDDTSFIPAPIGPIHRRHGSSAYPWRHGRVYILDDGGYEVRFSGPDREERLAAYQATQGGVRSTTKGSCSLVFSYDAESGEQ